jgi:hypothetical protein
MSVFLFEYSREFLLIIFPCVFLYVLYGFLCPCFCLSNHFPLCLCIVRYLVELPVMFLIYHCMALSCAVLQVK